MVLKVNFIKPWFTWNQFKFICIVMCFKVMLILQHLCEIWPLHLNIRLSCSISPHLGSVPIQSWSWRWPWMKHLTNCIWKLWKKNSKGFDFNQQKRFHTMFHFGYDLHNFWSNMFICAKWTFNRGLLPSSFKDYCSQIQLCMDMFSSTLSKDCASWKITI
jgi:hypothetical protein